MATRAKGLADFVSTSGFAMGDSLDKVMERLAPAGHVQVAIGPRPFRGDVVELLSGYTDAGVVLAAHANCPLGDRLLNQDKDYARILAVCDRAGIPTYTCHAPRRRDRDFKWFLAWAVDKWMEAAENGVSFAVETMYPATNPYFLDGYGEVYMFLEEARRIGWDKPLASDVAHLKIGVRQGTWTDKQVTDLLRQQVSLEFHYSDNDGVHDNHKPWKQGGDPMVDRWVAVARTHGSAMVDEGRRR